MRTDDLIEPWPVTLRELYKFYSALNFKDGTIGFKDFLVWPIVINFGWSTLDFVPIFLTDLDLLIIDFFVW